MGYVDKEIASPFITVQKVERIQLVAKPLHFLFTLSQSLSHTITEIVYNVIIPYTVMLQ